MQEINLLENRISDKSQVWSKRNQLLITIFTLVLILEVGLSAVFFLLTKNIDTNIQNVITENSAMQSEISSDQPGLLSAQSFQAQLKNVKTLLNSHVYWSVFFDELADFTLKDAFYVNFQASTQGEVHVEGLAPSYSDLGKLILGLNQSENFDDVKLLSVTPSTGESSGFNFSIDLVAGQKLFVQE